MKPARILFQIMPSGSLFRWKLLQDGSMIRWFFTQKGAIQEARRLAKFEWDTARAPSEIQIHGKDGKIREKDTWPRESDPRGNG